MKFDMIDLILNDSLQAMKSMKDNQFDWAIVDPPYGISVMMAVINLIAK